MYKCYIEIKAAPFPTTKGRRYVARVLDAGRSHIMPGTQTQWGDTKAEAQKKAEIEIRSLNERRKELEFHRDNASDKTLSYLHPNARRVCCESVEARKRFISSVKRKAVERTPEQQFHQLHNAIRGLEDVFNQYREGQTHLESMLLSSIGALVLFNETGPVGNRNPLLFRLAAYLDVPLAVYADSPAEGGVFLDQTLNNVAMHAITFPISLPRNSVSAKLTDLYGAMQLKCLEDNFDGRRDRLSILKILLKLRDQNASHYDQSVDDTVELLENTGFFGQNLIQSFTLNFTPVVIALGGFVVQQDRKLS